jgi:enamine deaminase RidA (YjgF/YER057c/UK114 family)
MRQLFENLSTALAAAGASMDQVVKLTVFLTDLADLPAFREVRDQYVPAARPPASSLVKMAGLVHPKHASRSRRRRSLRRREAVDQPSRTSH